MIRSAAWSILAILICAEASQAQFRFGAVPFDDPQDMLDRMFGEDGPADRETLRKIKVTKEDEQQFGEQLASAGLAVCKQEGIDVDSKGRDVEYLQSLVETLQPFMEHGDRYPNIRVLVAKSPRVDARSYPGGTLIFFEGLLDAAKSEAALAGIVGHELSHLDRGHQLLPLKRMKLMEAKFQQGFDPDDFFQNGPWMLKLMSRPFRPEDERDADEDGARWAFAAGYDPREMAKLFQRQAKKLKEPQQAIPFASYFSTHPGYRDRESAIQKQFVKLRKQHPQQELFIGEENLRDRKSRKQMEENP
jgi:predicted Zn-dependent protease